MIKIVPRELGGIRTFQGNDIVYGNPDIDLYANWCGFNCKYCHSKRRNKDVSDIVRPSDIIEIVSKFGCEVSIVGLGGDFAFQMIDWIEFCNKLKESHLGNQIKTVLYTGFNNFCELASFYMWIVPADLQTTDAILWGRHNGITDVIAKELTFSTSLHQKVSKKIRIPLEKRDG